MYKHSWRFLPLEIAYIHYSRKNLPLTFWEVVDQRSSIKICHLKNFTKFIEKYFRSSHQRFSIKKGVLRNFTEFTEKHLCQSLFLIKVQASGLKLY